MVPRPVQGAALRYGRQRRPDGLVGRPDRRRLAPDRLGRGRTAAAGGRRRRRPHVAQGGGGPPDDLPRRQASPPPLPLPALRQLRWLRSAPAPVVEERRLGRVSTPPRQ